MSAVDILLQLEAAHSGAAQRRTTMRHRHIDAKPLVIVLYRLAGESAAPLGMLYGTTAGKANLLVAPEPRNREIRFREVFNPFAADLCRYVSGRAGTLRDEGGRDICKAGPQLIVPNTATAEFAGPLLGRSLRYLRTEGEFAVPVDTVLAGAHLTWLGTQAELPGSSVILSATELLRRHWICGLSALETEDLHVQLGWIDPGTGLSGAEAAARMEEARFAGTLPAAGPTPDPSWDRDVLDPLIGLFNESRDGAADAATVHKLGADISSAVREALQPTWDATWRTIELLRGVPEAPSVPERWKRDRREFTKHAARVDTGEARFRTRDSVKQAALMVSQREEAHDSLEASEALDDPLVMAGVFADGRALTGYVTEVDEPWVTLELDGPCSVPKGTELYWTDMPTKCSVVVDAMSSEEPFTVTLETKKGKTKYYPEVDDRVAYSPFEQSWLGNRSLPATVPWTHVGPASEEPQPEVPE